MAWQAKHVDRQRFAASNAGQQVLASRRDGSKGPSFGLTLTRNGDGRRGTGGLTKLRVLGHVWLRDLPFDGGRLGPLPRQAGTGQDRSGQTRAGQDAWDKTAPDGRSSMVCGRWMDKYRAEARHATPTCAQTGVQHGRVRACAWAMPASQPASADETRCDAMRCDATGKPSRAGLELAGTSSVASTAAWRAPIQPSVGRSYYTVL